MMANEEETGCGCIGCGLLLVIGLCASWWTEGSLEFWLTYLKGQPVDIPFYLAVIVSVALNGAVIPFNVITMVAKTVL
jgi:hypothetical protein